MRIYGVRSVVGSHESVMMDRRNITLRALTLMISGVLAGKASANGFGLPDQDAFATARGEAFVATADNPSAIYYNPAGITQLEGNNLRGGLYQIFLDSSFNPPSIAPNHGHTYDNQDNYAAVPQIFCTYTPTNLPVSFGLGVYAPFGGNTGWPQNTGFRSVAIGGSLNISDDQSGGGRQGVALLSLGAGLMVNYANMEMDQGLAQIPTTVHQLFPFFRQWVECGLQFGSALATG